MAFHTLKYTYTCMHIYTQTANKCTYKLTHMHIYLNNIMVVGTVVVKLSKIESGN